MATTDPFPTALPSSSSTRFRPPRARYCAVLGSPLGTARHSRARGHPAPRLWGGVWRRSHARSRDPAPARHAAARCRGQGKPCPSPLSRGHGSGLWPEPPPTDPAGLEKPGLLQTSPREPGRALAAPCSSPAIPAAPASLQRGSQGSAAPGKAPAAGAGAELMLYLWLYRRARPWAFRQPGCLRRPLRTHSSAKLIRSNIPNTDKTGRSKWSWSR